MSRETKVGLVVAGSFICLAAIVVATKLHPRDAAARAPQEVAAAKETKARPPETKPVHHKETDKTVKPKEPAPIRTTSLEAPGDGKNPPPTASPLQIPSPVSDGLKQQNDLAAKISEQNRTPGDISPTSATNDPSRPSLPPPGASPMVPPLTLPGENPPGGLPPPPLPPKSTDAKPPVLPPGVNPDAVPPIPPPSALNPKPPVLPPNGTTDPKAGTDAKPASKPRGDATDPLPSLPTPNLTREPNSVISLPPRPGSEPKALGEKPVSPPKPANDVMPPPPLGPRGTPPPLGTNTGLPNTSPLGGLPPPPLDIVPPPPPIGTKPEVRGEPPVPPIGKTSESSRKGLPPPLGAEPAAMGAVPPAAPAPKNDVVLKERNVLTYECTADDTTFSRISEHAFSTDKYGAALAEFNRRFPGPIVLKPGAKVHIAPREYLESEFAKFIPGSTSSSAAPPPPPLGANVDRSSAPPLGNPPPVNPGLGTNDPNLPAQTRYVPVTGGKPVPIPVDNPNRPAPPPLPPSPPSSNGLSVGPPQSAASGGIKIYRVPEPGQHILEIAQKTLGDRRHWLEIYRLNANLQPQYPIRAGTELRMPANAAIP